MPGKEQTGLIPRMVARPAQPHSPKEPRLHVVPATTTPARSDRRASMGSCHSSRDSNSLGAGSVLRMRTPCEADHTSHCGNAASRVLPVALWGLRALSSEAMCGTGAPMLAMRCQESEPARCNRNLRLRAGVTRRPVGDGGGHIGAASSVASYQKRSQATLVATRWPAPTCVSSATVCLRAPFFSFAHQRAPPVTRAVGSDGRGLLLHSVPMRWCPSTGSDDKCEENVWHVKSLSSLRARGHLGDRAAVTRCGPPPAPAPATHNRRVGPGGSEPRASRAGAPLHERERRRTRAPGLEKQEKRDGGRWHVKRGREGKWGRASERARETRGLFVGIQSVHRGSRMQHAGFRTGSAAPLIRESSATAGHTGHKRSGPPRENARDSINIGDRGMEGCIRGREHRSCRRHQHLQCLQPVLRRSCACSRASEHSKDCLARCMWPLSHHVHEANKNALRHRQVQLRRL